MKLRTFAGVRFAIAAALSAGMLPVTQAVAGSQMTATRAALTTVSPQATQIGLRVLKDGGNAIDAAVAVAFALVVTHPQAGNLTGGGFLVYYEAKSKAVWTLDFRETAPLAAKRTMFQQKDGSPGNQSQVGPLASAVPGTVAGLDEMLRKFGTRPWKSLIAPSVALARHGFLTDAELTVDLHDSQATRKIDQFKSTSALFYPGGSPLPAGSRLIQQDLANVLERIAARGAADFYLGDTATRLVEGMRAGGGILSFRDLRDYRAIWRAPIRISFRNYQLYTMAPPSAGGLVLGETLNMLSGFDLDKLPFQSAAAIHLMAETERRAYVDRYHYLGDPGSTRIPYRELLSEERAKQWRTSIDPRHATSTASLKEPGGLVPEGDHTTHFSIVDSEGNIASITTTLNDNFGSGFVVPGTGLFTNDSMDDFTVAPGKPNRYGLVQGTANAIEPGRRMASSMSPTIILRDEKPFLVLGTRGGATIPTSVLQVFLNIAVWHKSLFAAVEAPRFHQQGLPEEIFYEALRAPQALVDSLAAMGHGLTAREPIGDIHAILIEKGKLTAVADPRHGGAAGGY